MALAQEAGRGYTNPFFDNFFTRSQAGFMGGDYTPYDVAMIPWEIERERRASQQDKITLFNDPIWGGKDEKGHLLLPGDGSAVILFHGLQKTPEDMSPLSEWLERITYTPLIAQMGSEGSIRKDIENLEEPLFVTLAYYENVILVGHSKGGFEAILLAAVVAQKKPKYVEKINVVTLGTPTHEPYLGLHPWMRASVKGSLQPRELALLREELQNVPEEIQARTTRIYTPDDRVVIPQKCIDLSSPSHHRSVRGSHSGLIHNAEVYRVLFKILPKITSTSSDYHA